MKKLLFVSILLFFSLGAMEQKDKEVSDSCTCPICLERLYDPSLITCAELFVDADICYHVHRDCIRKHLIEGAGVYGCPLCRKPVKPRLWCKYPREGVRFNIFDLQEVHRVFEDSLQSYESLGVDESVRLYVALQSFRRLCEREQLRLERDILYSFQASRARASNFS